MNIDQLKKLAEDAFADKEFVAALAEITTAEEAQKAFAAKGLEFSIEEIEKLGEMINNAGGELGEDELDSVSGGFNGMILIFGTLIVVSAIAGAKAGWHDGKKKACKDPRRD